MSDQPMVDERELLELFARRRADADRFAAGVAKRLAPPAAGDDAPATPDAPDAGDAGDSGDAGERSLPRAAAWLPFPLSGSKLWMWLSMPVLFLAGSWMAMFGAAGSIRRSLRERQGTGEANTHGTNTGRAGLPSSHPDAIAAKPGRRRFRTPAELAQLFVSGAVIAVPLLGWPDLFDAVLVACVASMVALAMLVKRAVRAGNANRVQVATLCSGLLETLLIFALVCSIPQLGAYNPGRWLTASVIVLALGIVALVRFAPRNVLNLALFAFGAAMVANMDLIRLRTPKMATMLQVEQFLAEARLEGNDTRLEEYTSTLLALRAAGHDISPPDDLAARITKPMFPGGPVDAATLTRCAYADLLPDEDWRRMAESHYHRTGLDELLTGSGPIAIPHYDHYLLRIAAAVSLTAAERANLTDRLLQSWPSKADQTPLEHARMVAWALDLLGSNELADQGKDNVHAQLVRQQDRSGWRRGGFRERAGDELQYLLPSDDVAMWLVARFGLPRELNGHMLRLHLKKRTELSRFGSRPGKDDEAFEAFAHLQQLDSLGPLPSRRLAQVILEERLLWAMIAMVLLCLYATSIAPHRPDDDATGAVRLPLGAQP